MGNILSSLPKTIHASLGLAVLLFLGLFFGNDGFEFDRYFWSWLFRFIHVVVAIMWIGLLWYFNFVQIPNMPKIPDEQKPAIGKIIAPAVLFWFRWAALATIVSGSCNGGTSNLIYCNSEPGTNIYSNIELVTLLGDNGTDINNNTSGQCDTYEDYTALSVTL